MTTSLSDGEHRADTRDPVLELAGTTVRFDQDRGESRVLNDVSVAIERNEILGVVGESGSGKSMFADSLLNAVVEPGVVTGEVTYHPREGDPVSVLDLDGEAQNRFRWEEIAMVFQGAMSSFNPVRTIETHFTETLRAHDRSVADGMERARTVLEDLYLDPERVLGSYPHELSGGMKQRALIALSLVLEPEVLVMDEPTAALDLLMQRSIISLIEELRAKYDLTIVFITHDLPLVADLADRLAVMYAFEFVEIGPAEEILRHAAHPYTRSLLKATPNPTMPLADIRPIEGSGPDPIDTPDGCSYHPRCRLADERCETDDPTSRPVDDAHEVHCHHWEGAEAAIPVGYGSDRGTSTTADGASGSKAARGVPSAGDRRDDAPVVSMRDVEVHFETESGTFDIGSEAETVRAVDGVDVDVYDNDVVVLVGESGCGKTTLGKTAIGLVEPTSGTVTYEGQDVWQARHRLGDIDVPYREIRSALQIVHQDPGSSLNSMRQVRSILAAPLKQWHRDKGKQDRLEVMLAMLEYVGLTPADDYLNRYPHQLSGGEKQRIALVRAMLMNPDLILADEPISALDVSLRVEMMDLMIELQGRFDTSYLFVSHDLSNARYIAGKTGGRIAVMYLGRIVEIGSVEQIVADPKHPYTEALRWATPELDPDADATGVDDAPMRGIDVPDPTDPPRGCRYHTRCPRVIPPEGYDFEQAEWNAVMDLKVAIERDGFDRSAVESIVEDGRDASDYSTDGLATLVRERFDVPRPLSDGDAERVLATGIDSLVRGETDQARELFEREFSTVCQTVTPDPVSATGDGDGRRVACFLESEEPDD